MKLLLEKKDLMSNSTLMKSNKAMVKRDDRIKSTRNKVNAKHELKMTYKL